MWACAKVHFLIRAWFLTSVVKAFAFCSFPAKRDPKPDLDPSPPDLQQNVPHNIANIPGKLGGAYKKPLFGRVYHPAYLAPPATN